MAKINVKLDTAFVDVNVKTSSDEVIYDETAEAPEIIEHEEEINSNIADTEVELIHNQILLNNYERDLILLSSIYDNIKINGLDRTSFNILNSIDSINLFKGCESFDNLIISKESVDIVAVEGMIDNLRDTIAKIGDDISNTFKSIVSDIRKLFPMFESKLFKLSQVDFRKATPDILTSIKMKTYSPAMFESVIKGHLVREALFKELNKKIENMIANAQQGKFSSEEEVQKDIESIIKNINSKAKNIGYEVTSTGLGKFSFINLIGMQGSSPRAVASQISTALKRSKGNLKEIGWSGESISKAVKESINAVAYLRKDDSIFMSTKSITASLGNLQKVMDSLSRSHGKNYSKETSMYINFIKRLASSMQHGVHSHYTDFRSVLNGFIDMANTVAKKIS